MKIITGFYNDVTKLGTILQSWRGCSENVRANGFQMLFCWQVAELHALQLGCYFRGVVVCIHAAGDYGRPKKFAQVGIVSGISRHCPEIPPTTHNEQQVK